MKTAITAGWSRADLVWERLLEGALQQLSEVSLTDLAVGQSQLKKAYRLLHQAKFICHCFFNNDDLRLGTVYANLALLMRHSNKHKVADKYQQKALKQWIYAESAIARADIAPRSRSSLFHLRMEARHRDVFHNNVKARLTKFAAEAEQTIQQLAQKQPRVNHRHFSRWRGERPSVFDDTRKVLAACLLVTDIAHVKPEGTS